MLAKSHYFNCFSKELHVFKPESDVNKEMVLFQKHFSSEEYQDLNLIKKILFLRYLETNSFHWGGINKNKCFKSFFAALFPNKALVLELRGVQEPLVDISLCFGGIIRNSSRVTKMIIIQTFRINHHQLKRLIASYSHVTIMGLASCKISVPNVLNFTGCLRNSKINKLDLTGSGSLHYSDWKKNTEQFKNLIKGLATYPGMMMSLNKIDITYSTLKVEDARNILTENEFEDTKIISWE
ncbi:unnamed protein product [Moneuplotes crassus]|uniref:Uncharacterized protein n=1 Tax=Euplotes crassus TaxID=5936 RepID=A0AAD1XJY7_EUPCR|nr:unnamed protein product [Moneuplotes crassus]